MVIFFFSFFVKFVCIVVAIRYPAHDVVTIYVCPFLNTNTFWKSFLNYEYTETKL